MGWREEGTWGRVRRGLGTVARSEKSGQGEDKDVAQERVDGGPSPALETLGQEGVDPAWAPPEVTVVGFVYRGFTSTWTGRM